MKSFILTSILSLAATLTAAIPIAQTSPPPTTPLVTSPPLPLSRYQLPVILNGNECIAPYLVMVMDSTKPDEPIPKIQQIGPNAFVAMHFNSTHAGKLCRFHFAFSSLADGGNGKGTEEIYALKSGVIDEKLTFNNQPTLEDTPVASFYVVDPVIVGDPPNEIYPFASRQSYFECPTTSTGWAIRSKDSSLSNWSWNHGLIVEVADGPNGTWWEHGDKY